MLLLWNRPTGDSLNFSFFLFPNPSSYLPVLHSRAQAQAGVHQLAPRAKGNAYWSSDLGAWVGLRGLRTQGEAKLRGQLFRTFLHGCPRPPSLASLSLWSPHLLLPPRRNEPRGLTPAGRCAALRPRSLLPPGGQR